MTWGILTVGGVPLRETLSVDERDGNLRVRGQESSPTKTPEWVHAVHANLRGLRDTIVPAVFTDKADLTGFYLVDAVSSELFDFANGSTVTATWELALIPVGSTADVSFESLLPAVGLADTLPGLQTPTFWHAPPVGTTSYFTGSTVPTGVVQRVSADGVVKVFTGLPAVAPRWSAPAASFLSGSARVTVDGIRRVGQRTPAGAVWEIDNGLVRVRSAGGGDVDVSAWSGTPGGWTSTGVWRFSVAGTDLTVVPEFTILRNDPEQVVVRLTYPGVPGLTTVDLSLRRGARFVTGVMRRHAAASSLGIHLVPSTIGTTAVTGGMRRTANDSDGNRWAAGSAQPLTTGATTNATAVTAASTGLFDFFLGHELGGSAAQAGDAFADLLAQYLGTAGDRTKAIIR